MAAATLQGAGTRIEAEDLKYENFPMHDENKKVVRISSWLKKVHGNWLVPFYEVDEGTIDLLYDLVEYCEDTESDVSLLIEDMKHQEAVHEAATKEMQDIFKDLGLSPISLSRKAFICLSSLAKSAVILKTKDVSLSSLFCAINNMTSEKFEIWQKNVKIERKLDVTEKELSSVLMLEKQLLEDIENIEQCQAKENITIKSRSEIMSYLRDKSLELRIRIRRAETELTARKLDRSLTHDALVKFSEELAALQKKNMSLKQKLSYYSNLPYSIPLAKVKVEEAKRELKALENELLKQLEIVPFETM